MTRALAELINQLRDLPGIGEKSAQRIARYILRLKDEEAKQLSDSIITARARIRMCTKCGNLTEEALCSICSDRMRLQTEICVVEDSFDIPVIERSGAYKGLYHVLGGVLSPLEDVSPDELRIDELLTRIKEEGTEEVILATSATTEGEATSSYIAEKLQSFKLKISRIARGIPVGTDLGLADEVTIGKALRGREHIAGRERD